MLTPLPLFGEDSDNTDVFDFGGAIKTINLTGVYVDTTVANVKTSIDDMENLVNGNQSSENGYPLSFVDDYRGTLNVKIMQVQTTKVRGEPLIMRWVVKLVESNTIS